MSLSILFDMDDEIEFLYVDYSSPALGFVTEVINEDGVVLFSALGQAPLMNPSAPQDQLPIRNTPEGTKLILSDDGSGNGEAHVYGLPGTLHFGMEENVFTQNLSGGSMKAYPNPSANEVKIEYKMPFGAFGTLMVADELGRMVQTVQPPANEGTYTLDASGLGAGVYFCTLLSGAEVLATKKLSVVKEE